MVCQHAASPNLRPAMPPRKRAKSSAPVTEVSTLWNGGGQVSSIASDGSGNVFVSSDTCIYKISDGVETVVAGGDEAGYLDGPQGMFSGIVGLAVDADGCLIVSESGDYSCIRKVAVDGQVSTLAGDPGGDDGYMDGQGAEARFECPGVVTMDLDGNVLVADSMNNCIRKVAPDGTVSTIAGTPEEGYADGPAEMARFDGPQGVAVDQEGNVFVADTANHSIRKISRDGAVSTLAGSTEGECGDADGAGDAARFSDPMALAVDIDGNIVVADAGNHCIRKVTPEGVVSTLAGPTTLAGPNTPGNPTFGNVDGPANQARFSSPQDMAIDMDGNVLVVDYHNKSVRMITHTGLSRGVALPRWPVVKPALAANLVALLDDERFADVSFGTHAPSAPTVALGSYRNNPAPTLSTLPLAPSLALPLSALTRARAAHRCERHAHPCPPQHPRGALRLLQQHVRLAVPRGPAGGRRHRGRDDASRLQEAARLPLLRRARARRRGGGRRAQRRLTPPPAPLHLTAWAWVPLLNPLFAPSAPLPTPSAPFEPLHNLPPQVMRKAHEFSLVRAYNLCMRHCVRGVSSANAIAWLVRAEECRLDDLRGVALGFVQRHFRRLRAEAPATLDSLRAHPDLMLEVMKVAI